MEIYKRNCLSNDLWEIKEYGINYKLKQKIIDIGTTYNQFSNTYNVFIKQKNYLIIKKDLVTVNNNDEFGVICS